MNRRLFGIGFAAWILSAAASEVSAAESPAKPAKVLVNVDKEGVALQGHDPVAFFTVKAPVKGKAEFASEHGGARYLFHSAANKAAFDKEPGRYVPQLGGFCAYGVGRGALVGIRVEAWQVVDGRLLMQKDPSIRDAFNEDPKANLAKADARWSGLLERKGR